MEAHQRFRAFDEERRGWQAERKQLEKQLGGGLRALRSVFMLYWESTNREPLSPDLWGVPNGPRKFHPLKLSICLGQTLRNPVSQFVDRLYADLRVNRSRRAGGRAGGRTGREASTLFISPSLHLSLSPSRSLSPSQ